MIEITEEDLARIVREELGECPVEIWQTGGGVATAYLGTPLPDPDEDGERYWLAAGPGSFDGPGWTRAVFTYDELCIGPDSSYGEEVVRYCANEGDLRAALRAFARLGDWRAS